MLSYAEPVFKYYCHAGYVLQSHGPGISVRRFGMTVTPVSSDNHTVGVLLSYEIAILSHKNENSQSYSNTILPYSNTLVVILSHKKLLATYYSQTKCAQQSYKSCHTVRLPVLGTILQGAFQAFCPASCILFNYSKCSTSWPFLTR